LGRTTGGDDLSRAPDAWQQTILGNSEAIVRELAAGTGEHLASSRLAELRAPVRWLVGDSSDPAFSAAAARGATILSRVSTTRVEGCGHGVAWDRPEAVANAVRACL
jgi:pimeloyl-ACP methyl ester carboxylesterase